MYGESTWTSSAGSDVDGSQLEDKWERKGRAGKSGYFTLLHGLISTSTLPVQKPASSRSVLLSFSAHNCMIYLLSLIHSSFSLPLFWQISTVSFKPHLRKHPVPSASARYFLVYSRPRCKPIRSLKEIPNLCKYPSPVIAEVKSTTERERNTRRFFSGTENRKALRYNTALKGKEKIAAVNGVVSLYEPYCSVMIDRWQAASRAISF